MNCFSRISVVLANSHSSRCHYFLFCFNQEVPGKSESLRPVMFLYDGAIDLMHYISN